MKLKWFDEHGYLIRQIPKEAIADCAHPGPCDTDVDYWQRELDFTAPREQMIEYLEPYGAWAKDELDSKTDDELAQMVLWLAAGDIKENGEWIGLIH